MTLDIKEILNAHYRDKLASAVAAAKAEPLDPSEMLEDLGQTWARSTAGVWSQGFSSHQTVSVDENGKEYHISNWRHAEDAQFADTAHALVPQLLAYIAALQEQINNLKSSKEGT